MRRDVTASRPSSRWAGAVVLSVLTLLLGALQAAPAAAATPFSLLYSTSAQRTAPAPLQGTTLSGPVYVFTSPTDGAGVSEVRFWLDDPGRAGAPRVVERGAPHDFAGSDTRTGLAKPFDVRTLTAGTHTITAEIVPTGGGASTVLQATFTHGASTPTGTFASSPASLSFAVTAGGPGSTKSLTVSASGGAATAYSASASAPWLRVTPLTGTTPAVLSVTVDPATLPAGSVSGSVSVTGSGLPDLVVPVSVTVSPGTGASAFSLVYSKSAKRTAPQPLSGASVSGLVYPLLAPAESVTSVSFWLDDPQMTGPSLRTDTTAPFDFAPGSVTHSAAPLDTAGIADGPHTITARVTSGSGTVVVAARFTSSNGTNALSFDPSRLTLAAEEGGSAVTATVTVSAQVSGTAVSISSDTPWLSASVSTLTAPGILVIRAAPAGLSPGQWSGTLRASAPGAFDALLTVDLVVGDTGGCKPVACNLIKVGTPYNLDWRYDGTGIIDSTGAGTGFTTLLKPTQGDGYRSEQFNLDISTGTLDLTTTGGSPNGSANDQDNMLGVGFDGPAGITQVNATLPGLPQGMTGKYEQAGVWFGYDQDHYDRLMVVSTPTGVRFEHVLEVGGVEVARKNSPLQTIGSDKTLALTIKVDPVKRSATGYYKVGDSALVPLGTFTVPGEFFSFDAAGIDPRIGTRSFGGLHATQRSATRPVTFQYSSFSVTGEQDVTNSPDFPFARSSFDVPFPTSMALGPDGRLYVLSLFGKVYALTLDAQQQVVSQQVISTLGTRMALGIAVDPASTPGNVVLWVSNSSPSIDEGEVDSGHITRLSGPGFSVKQEVITGLPRSIANHGTNSIHFGPDGRLFLAQGGNTGAGAANTAKTEFGDRGEQPLSAAVLVADVQRPGFDGACADPSDMYRSGLDCDVETYATGLRNPYDFVVHSNGRMYATNNGLGVVGSYPPSPTAPCTGLGDTRPWNVGGGNPGLQNDDLNLIEQGRYYGSPNPSRGECVFKDGHYQGVPAPANYTPPILDLGPNRSSNGIIEYSGDAFCGRLDKALLISNYSLGDDLTLVRLADDGRSTVSASSLVGGFKDPLPIVQLPGGAIAVGEFGGDKVTVLSPKDIGCWDSAAPLPEKLLDAGSVTIGSTIYALGGKTSQGHSPRLWAYDTTTGTWTRKADLPSAGVENAAVATYGGRLYAFGGSTDAFSGAQSASFVWTPSTNSWATLPAMPTARGGATAQVLGSKVLVAGGMVADGSSTAVVEAYDIATAKWSTAAPMGTARDNAGSAAIAGKLYVFGGRTRLPNGQVPEGTLASSEVFDPATGAWSARASMPTGRRTMATGTAGSTAVLVGGEVAPDGSAFDVTELYDATTDTWRVLRRVPTPRHGAIAGVVAGRLHVVGGGPVGGLSFTDTHEVLTLPSAG